MTAHAANSARTWFWRIFWGTLALKISLSAVVPISGDEALFVQWGKRPDWGYYDHPPMVGWMLHLLMQLGDSRPVIRFFTVITPHLIALGLVDIAQRLFRTSEAPRAWWLGAVYLLSPWSILFVIVTTDTPVVFFMALACWAFIHGQLSRKWSWTFVAGLSLGLAFLSKYFAVLLGAVFFTYIIFLGKRKIATLLAVVGPAALLALINLFYNATHGWPNVMFNLLSRQNDQSWSLSGLAIYLGMMIYLFTPWLLWGVVKRRHDLRTTEAPLQMLLLWLWLIPLGIFAFVSLRHEIGLHWVLGFIPFFLLWAATRLSALQLEKFTKFSALWSVPHLALIAALIWWPIDRFYPESLREKLVFLRDSSAVTQRVDALVPSSATLMATGYSTASVLAYWHGTYVPVFGEGSKYARQDDLWTDFREFTDRDIYIFTQDLEPADRFLPFFKSVQIQQIQHKGIRYSLVHGQGFVYEAYKDQVLNKIHQRYFQIPSMLPILGNPFCEHYSYSDCRPGRPL